MNDEAKLQYEYIEKAKKIIEEKAEKKGSRLTCCVHTFGCQMNARDSEKLSGLKKLRMKMQTSSFTIPAQSVTMPTSVSTDVSVY